MKLYNMYPHLTKAGQDAYVYTDYLVYRNEVDVDYDTETVKYDYTIKNGYFVVKEEMTFEEVIDFFNDLGSLINEEMTTEEVDKFFHNLSNLVNNFFVSNKNER